MIFIIIFSLIFSTYTFSDTITISSGEYAPWCGEKIKDNGFVLDVTRKAFEVMGHKVEISFYPWKRSYEVIKSGQCIAGAYWLDDKVKRTETYYSDPVMNEEVVFFYKKTNPISNWNILKDLVKYRIGVTIGYTYTSEFWKMGTDKILNFDEAVSDDSNFKKLNYDRIDIFPCEVVTGYTVLRNLFDENIVSQFDHNKKPLTTTTGHIIFTKNNPKVKEYLEIFNKGLKKLKDDGTYKALYEKLLKGYYK
ncbi:MAG: hypothetical protein A2086_09675 [Spirochaetes bacterium GWD1_27_9]|nr:MAG: hypothetical protein A2Z98_11955 [Spirochaetes bacterium GWB1_27_13]OHD20455.1 MAG: hypothetical protein A2Y34_02065 [Spirochaetes bacterium GWC1_27_15]OHD32024.1 MAG: hypothetical protein A2086_09675 [Spirochaetes bacterium GWD1_27_9]